MTGCVRVVNLGKRWQQDALWEEGRLMEAVLCSGQSSDGKSWPDINLDVPLTHSTYLNIVVVHFFIMFTDGSGLSLQDNASFHTAKIDKECFKGHDK